MTTRVVGAELWHVDRRTDWHDEANSPFSQSRDSPCLVGTVCILRKASQDTRDATLVVKCKAVLSSRGLHVVGPH